MEEAWTDHTRQARDAQIRLRVREVALQERKNRIFDFFLNARIDESTYRDQMGAAEPDLATVRAELGQCELDPAFDVQGVLDYAEAG